MTTEEMEKEVYRLRELVAAAQEAAATKSRTELSLAADKASAILNDPSRNPDDDTSILARQFLRLYEREHPGLKSGGRK